MAKKQISKDSIIFQLKNDVYVFHGAIHDALQVLLMAIANDDTSEQDKDAVINCAIARLVAGLQIVDGTK